MRNVLFFIASFVITAPCFAQDSSYARRIVDTLTSTTFWGRGYTNDGMKKAAHFIAAELQAYGLKPINGRSFFQSFAYPVNAFPGKMEVSINDRQLIPGTDFIVAPESRGVAAAGTLSKLDSTHFIDPVNKIIVSIENKLTWSVSDKQSDYTAILVERKAMPKNPSTIKVNIESKLIERYKVANIFAIVAGTVQPDSVMVISAHYDHLGGMGNGTYFPGANDNASGISLFLGLAKYYVDHPQKYSMAFICFAGEEAGLLGSKYYTEHPLLPLNKIRFLINLDLVGTGTDGITVVNASEFPTEFSVLNQVNDQKKYEVKINARGRAANSDHYWFTEKGVPAFFIYTLGGITAYHDVFDKSDTLPLNEYEDLFKLLVEFNSKLMY